MKIAWVKIKGGKQFLKNSKRIKIIKELIAQLNRECLIIKVERLCVKRKDQTFNKLIIISILMKMMHNNLIHNGSKQMIALVLLKIIKNTCKAHKNLGKCKQDTNPDKIRERGNQKIKVRFKEVLLKKDNSWTMSQLEIRLQIAK